MDTAKLIKFLKKPKNNPPKRMILLDAPLARNRKIKGSEVVFIVESKYKNESISNKLRRMITYSNHVWELPDIFTKDRLQTSTATSILETIGVKLDISKQDNTYTTIPGQENGFNYTALLEAKPVDSNGAILTSTMKIHPEAFQETVDINILSWYHLLRAIDFSNIEISSTDNNLKNSSKTFKKL